MKGKKVKNVEEESKIRHNINLEHSTVCRPDEYDNIVALLLLLFFDSKYSVIEKPNNLTIW